MDSSVSPKDEVWFLHMCHHISTGLYLLCLSGIFIGPQIRDIIKDEYFDKLLQGDEKAAWDSFKFVVKVFLGNRRAQNYEELVNNRFAELPEIRLQHVTKNTLPSSSFGFFSQRILVE